MPPDVTRSGQTVLKGGSSCSGLMQWSLCNKEGAFSSTAIHRGKPFTGSNRAKLPKRRWYCDHDNPERVAVTLSVLHSTRLKCHIARGCFSHVTNQHRLPNIISTILRTTYCTCLATMMTNLEAKMTIRSKVVPGVTLHTAPSQHKESKSKTQHKLLWWCHAFKHWQRVTCYLTYHLSMSQKFKTA